MPTPFPKPSLDPFPIERVRYPALGRMGTDAFRFKRLTMGTESIEGESGARFDPVVFTEVVEVLEVGKTDRVGSGFLSLPF